MKDETKLIHLGRGKIEHEGTVNLPVYRASTILSPDVESYIHRFDGNRRYENITYGAAGTQNARALAEAVAALEGGYRSVVTASGLSAIATALAAFVEAGDHILVSDAVYGPTRRLCLDALRRFGVETTFYDPGIGSRIVELLRDDTRLVFMEAPSSLTFEMQDVPAICRAAKERGVLTLMDNTWATPLYFKPLAHGVDISIQAGTKYIAGHSDLVIGVVTARSEEHYKRVADQARTFGDVAGPDDCYLALRGLRTLAVRLERQQRSTLRIASHLAGQAAVRRVLYPPLPDDPGHALWRRDFTGASSLFGLALRATDVAAAMRMIDGLELFQIGSSWGGYESLVAFNHTPLERAILPWTETPFLLRLHIGLEDPDDLIADLDAGLARLGEA
jgi:cystathionine beta-lyase